MKKTLIVLACLVVVGGCGWWTWRTQFNRPKFNVALHTGLGQVLAEETARVMNNTGKVVLVTLDAGTSPELTVQMAEFKKTLLHHPGIVIKETYELETDDKPKYRFGAGLSARRYVRLVNKNQSAGAFVSFVGAPDLADKDVAAMQKIPKLIAECRSTDKLRQAFELKALHAALVGRYEYPTPIKGTPGNPRDWVTQRFQIVTAENAHTLPGGSSDGDVDVKPR